MLMVLQEIIERREITEKKYAFSPRIILNE